MKIIKKSCLAVICLIAGAFLISANAIKVSAAADRNYDTCVAQSGSPDVDNVRETCRAWGPDYVDNYCSLWIGVNKDNKITLNTYQTEGKIDVYMYGMCTSYGHEADNVQYTSGDNSSISLPPKTQNRCGFWSPTIDRGYWGSPIATAVKLDVKKFTQGVTGVRNGNYMSYTRTIVTYRCYKNSSFLTCAGSDSYGNNLQDFCGPSTSAVTLNIYDPLPVNRKLTLIYSTNPSTDFPTSGTWNQSDSKLKKVINYNSGGFTNGTQFLKIKPGIDPYQSATAPATITVGDETYKINRVLATDYKDKVTNCDSESVKVVHSTQSTAFTNGDGSTTNGCQSIYVVYEMQKRTLTAYARPDSSHYFKADGTVVSDTSGIWTNSSTVDYGGTATVTTSGFNPTGYTWNKWGSQGACSGAGTNRSCTVSNLTSNTTVNAYYTRNSFNARARASKGSSWEGENSVNSGFIKSGTANTAKIACSSDSGCTAGFWFDLKTLAGSGSTTYTIQKRSDTKDSNGNWVWSDLSGLVNISSTPGTGAEGTEVYTRSDNLSIGSRVCYRIKYYPYGDESNSTTKTVSVCAEIVPSTFIGKTEVSGAASATAGWTDASNPVSKSEVTSVENCSPTDGCKVTFKHYLQRTAGAAATTYYVQRSSNLTTTTKGISGGKIKDNTSFSSNSATVVNESANLKLYPGMVVCERLTFKPNNLPGTTDNIYTRACVHAHGNAQPPDDPDPDRPEDPDSDSGDSTFLNIKVKNPDAAAKYNKYQGEVYAKPGDNLTYRATYNPVLQYTYYLVPKEFQIDGGTIYSNDSGMLYTLFNANKSPGWNNAFSVQKGTNNASYSLVADGNYVYDGGDFTKRQEINTYSVTAANVGKSIDERALTNLNTTTRTTPRQVSFTDHSGKNLANVITTQVIADALARVPYNFENTTQLTDPDKIKLFAGESATISLDYIINPRQNSETSPNTAYSTKVDKPKWKLAVNIGNGGWNETEEASASSSSVSISEMYSSKTIKRSVTINVPDVAAGTEICIIPMIYPSNSGAATNYTDPEGSHAWVRDTNTQHCFKVAKKPNIEIWGGNVYSRGTISTSVTSKNSLEGKASQALTGDPSTNGKNRYVFGSWVESGLISNGKVTGLASGAGTGFGINNNGNLVPAYTFGNDYNGQGNNSPLASAHGGSYEVNQDFCIRSTLTFANEGCTGVNGAAGMLNSASTNNNIENDKSAILRKFVTDSFSVNASGDVSLNNEANITSSGIYYYYGNSSLNLLSGSVNKGTIQVVHSTRDITIAGDITYAEGESFADIDEIPKLIIYAQNVIIDCRVARIDALIIAEDTVNTCNSGDIRDENNSNQLKINGAVIADRLVANRTYGAATGANSVIPAEIINFDPSLYLWGGNNSEDSGSANSMDVNYIHEMAPRY